MESHFRIDQSGEVDHYIWGNLRPVWEPLNTWDSSCNRPLPKHGLSDLPGYYNTLILKKNMEEMTLTKTLHCHTSYLVLLPSSSILHCTPFLSSDLLLLSCRSSNLCSKFPQSALYLYTVITTDSGTYSSSTDPFTFIYDRNTLICNYYIYKFQQKLLYIQRIEIPNVWSKPRFPFSFI